MKKQDKIQYDENGFEKNPTDLNAGGSQSQSLSEEDEEDVNSRGELEEDGTQSRISQEEDRERELEDNDRSDRDLNEEESRSLTNTENENYSNTGEEREESRDVFETGSLASPRYGDSSDPRNGGPRKSSCSSAISLVSNANANSNTIHSAANSRAGSLRSESGHICSSSHSGNASISGSQRLDGSIAQLGSMTGSDLISNASSGGTATVQNSLSITASTVAPLSNSTLGLNLNTRRSMFRNAKSQSFCVPNTLISNTSTIGGAKDDSSTLSKFAPRRSQAAEEGFLKDLAERRLSVNFGNTAAAREKL